MAYFTGIFDACMVVGEHIRSGIGADFVEILSQCLGKDNGIGHLDTLENMGINLPVAKDNLNISIKAWVK